MLFVGVVEVYKLYASWTVGPVPRDFPTLHRGCFFFFFSDEDKEEKQQKEKEKKGGKVLQHDARGRDFFHLRQVTVDGENILIESLL
jgi:hypothetical protein